MIFLHKSTHEEHLFQPFLTCNKFKIAVTFLTGYNGLFNVTDKNIKFYFVKSLTEVYIIINIPNRAYELESLNDKIKRKIIYEDHYTEENYLFKIKPNFNTLGSIIEVSTQRPIITFVPDDGIGDLLGFDSTTKFSEYNQSNNPVDILSFDNIFLETDIAQGMILTGKRPGILHDFTKDVALGYKYFEKIRCGPLWYMMGTKDFASSISFK